MNEKYARDRIFRTEPGLVTKITSEITAKDIDDYIQRRLAKGIKPNTVQREMALWKGFSIILVRDLTFQLIQF